MSELKIKFLDARSCSPTKLAMDLRKEMRSFFSSQEESVRRIIADVFERGDDAVVEYERKYGWSNCTADKFMVSEEEIEDALRSIDEDVLSSLKVAMGELERYHVRNAPISSFEHASDGSIFAELVSPVQSVLIYAPGGRAPYPSTVLHVGVPAMVAGVQRIYVTTPPDKDGFVHPAILVAAKLIGAEAVFRIGGAHAIAAFAFGTESIPKVDMVAGPGGMYVVTAKRLLYGVVGIDLLPGPSEVFIIADDNADAELVAVDMLAQAEHGEDSAAVLATPSEELIARVQEELSRLLEGMERSKVALEALNSFGALILTATLDQAIEACNEYAPEHVELHCSTWREVILKIRNAGAIFVGGTPTAYGDYAAGPSHVLPTLGASKFSSGLSVESFIKKTRCVLLSNERILRLGEHVKKLAELEGLRYHALSVEARLKRLRCEQKELNVNSGDGDA